MCCFIFIFPLTKQIQYVLTRLAVFFGIEVLNTKLRFQRKGSDKGFNVGYYNSLWMNRHFAGGELSYTSTNSVCSYKSLKQRASRGGPRGSHHGLGVL